MEVALGAACALLQLCRKRGEHLETCIREHPAEAELRRRGRSDEQRLRLRRGQAGQLGSVTTRKAVAAGGPSDRLDWNPCRTESLEITMNRADRNLEMGCQLRSGELSSKLQHEQQRNQAGRPHRAGRYMTEDGVYMT